MPSFAKTFAAALCLGAALHLSADPEPFADYFLSWKKSLLVNASQKKVKISLIAPAKPVDPATSQVLQALASAIPCIGKVLIVNPEDDRVISVLETVDDSFEVPPDKVVGIVTLPTFKFIRVGMRISMGFSTKDRMDILIQGTSVFSAALKQAARKSGKTEAYETAKAFLGGKIQASPRNPEKTSFQVLTPVTPKDRIQFHQENFENASNGPTWIISDES